MATLKTPTKISAPRKTVRKTVAAKKLPVTLPLEKPVATTHTKDTVGVIGLGIMGSAIATNLHTAGFHVVGFDPSKEQQKIMRKVGITIAKDIAELATQSKFIVMSLPSVYALESVVDQIGINAKAGTIVAELGTLPHEAKEAACKLLAIKNIILLDCPLSGTGAQAKTRDLAVYASGDKKAIAAMDHVFEGFARVRYNVGAFGQGMKMKLVANHLVAIHNISTAEGILLGVQMGIDPHQIVSVIADGAGTSRMFQVRGPMMADRTWNEATMKIDVWAKDMHLIGEAIKNYNVPAPLFSACLPIYNAAKAMGHAKDDTAVVYKVLEGWAVTPEKMRASEAKAKKLKAKSKNSKAKSKKKAKAASKKK